MKKIPPGFYKLEGRIIITAATQKHGEEFCQEQGMYPRDPHILIVTPDSCQKLLGLRLTASDKILHSPTMHLYRGEYLKIHQLNEQIKLLISHARRR